MNFETLALDAESVRRYDDNGNLHVAVSHLTKAQVRPYYGAEIPGWERLRLDPQKVYKGYCPPEELARKETVESTNGIPIQLNHHSDYADDPAISTRIGSTGTDGVFTEPYLDNSLHFTVKKAIDRILDGSMRELSLAYRYKPDFTPGKTPDDEDYDFVMRDITANHLALVEKGRAGDDVLVFDSSIKEKSMDEVKEKTAVDNDPAVEKKEVALAGVIDEAAQAIKDLHTQDEEGNVVDKPTDDVAADEDKNAAIERIIADMVAKGMSEEDAKSFSGALHDLAYSPDEAQDSDEQNVDPCEKLIADGLKDCGYDSEPEEVQKAFAEGVRYGEKKEKTEPKKLDREHEREGEERALGQDAAMKSMESRIARSLEERFAAMDECKATLGNVRFTAYDSAGSVYLAALKQEGVNVSGVSADQARSAYRAFMAGKSRGDRGMAQDNAIKQGKSTLFSQLNKIKRGI